MNNIFKIGLLIGMLSIFANQAYGEYSSSCSMFAQMLWSAADAFDSEKSNFDSACNRSYGYSKDDESACGSYGYARSGYDNAKRELEDAQSNVGLFCGTCDQFIRIMKSRSQKKLVEANSEISKLRARIKALEAKN